MVIPATKQPAVVAAKFRSLIGVSLSFIAASTVAAQDLAANPHSASIAFPRGKFYKRTLDSSSSPNQVRIVLDTSGEVLSALDIGIAIGHWSLVIGHWSMCGTK